MNGHGLGFGISSGIWVPVGGFLLPYKYDIEVYLHENCTRFEVKKPNPSIEYPLLVKELISKKECMLWCVTFLIEWEHHRAEPEDVREG